jgi:hypothetical protein
MVRWDAELERVRMIDYVEVNKRKERLQLIQKVADKGKRE